MRIAVTGAHGFVGLNVARTLANDGHEVVAIARREPDAWVTEFLRDAGRVRHLIVDVSQPGAMTDALWETDLDAVIHAAVVTATTLEVERAEAARIIHVNTGGTIEALEAARTVGAQRFVYVSSPSAIGEVPAETSVDESVDKRPTTLYGMTKDASEEITRRYGEIHGMPVALVRIAQPYGPGERATASRVRTSPIYEWLLDAEARRTIPAGPLDRARDWTYIDDTARGITTLATAEALQHDLYHLARGELITVCEVIEQIRTAFPDLKCTETPSDGALNPNIAASGKRQPLDSTRFREEFGWMPETGIEEGMQRYLEWWKSFSP